MLCILVQYIQYKSSNIIQSSNIIRYPIPNLPEFLFQELHGLREELAIPREPGAQPWSMRMLQNADATSGDLGERPTEAKPWPSSTHDIVLDLYKHRASSKFMRADFSEFQTVLCLHPSCSTCCIILQCVALYSEEPTLSEIRYSSLSCFIGRYCKTAATCYESCGLKYWNWFKHIYCTISSLS